MKHLISESRDLISGEKKEITLPKSNVLSYKLPDCCGLIVRPSGTEPKIKVYLLVRGKSAEDCEAKVEKYKEFTEAIGK